MKDMENYPRVNILIPTYNRHKILKECINSIVEQNYPKNLVSITVLDDDSCDETAEFCSKYLQELKQQGFAKTTFLKNEANSGIAYGRWMLGEKAEQDAEFLLFFDDDAKLTPDCLKILIEYMTKHKDTGVVGPRIVYANAPHQTAHCANFVGKWTAKYSEKNSTEPISCDWIFTICLMVRSAVYKAVGGFYPGYYICHQEVDFCLRVKSRGFSVVYNPVAVVYHRENPGQRKRERLYYLYRNKILVVRRCFPFVRKIFALVFIFVVGLPKYVLESFRLHKKAVFAEIKIIFLALMHGLFGREGKYEN